MQNCPNQKARLLLPQELPFKCSRTCGCRSMNLHYAECHVRVSILEGTIGDLNMCLLLSTALTYPSIKAHCLLMFVSESCTIHQHTC